MARKLSFAVKANHEPTPIRFSKGIGARSVLESLSPRAQALIDEFRAKHAKPKRGKGGGTGGKGGKGGGS